eukprot:Plantae.Rhodophyta-Hildenbrandia_rubra.ctg3872.p1 GENE.Plantae.Rhodophyta-Hildenbrandia_rubra.ctg3872~~Plantae.Rhodophyta-Hildenbrandia_rubra.ctg3872.p1  ORF type:complete len:542 (-),score=139.01 Plantae.Rhodophyta-Hildenbrandia_rubra.ctg3872:138-1763(-)
MAALAIRGDRESGQDVRNSNITACVSVANIVKSSLGPMGLEKMLVDEVGDVTVTHDGATILRLLEVEHPAAKVLTGLAAMQDDEVGDGTTSVVIIAAELLKRANDLVKKGIHPTSVIAGYKMAVRESCKYIRDKLAVPVDKLGRECLVNAAATAISSKILGSANSDKFANMAVDAVLAVKTKNLAGTKDIYPIDSIHVMKAQGRSAEDSELLAGYALNLPRSSQSMPKKVAPAKIACLDMDLRRAKMKMGISVLIENPEELNKAQEKEQDITRDRIQSVLKAGANVVLTTRGIDDSALKVFAEANAIAVRRVSESDMKRIAEATGATIQASMADMQGEESFDASLLGQAAEVYEERIRDDNVIILKGCKSTAACSVLLRGPNEYMCDEMSRAFHDAVCVVKRVLESKAVVAGGGCVEAALSIHLENFARMLGSREQLAIAEFAEALLVIPKTLAVNAAKDAIDLVAKLRAIHNAAQADESKAALASSGLDLSEGKIRNNMKAGVIEPAISKKKSIQFAAEAALTIIRIDDVFKLAKEEQPQ